MENSYLPSLDPEKGTWDEQALTRRQFLMVGFWSATCAATLIVGGVGTRFLIGHSLVGRAEGWIALGNLSELPPKQMHRVTYSYRAKDLWRDIEQFGVLYVYSEDGATFTVLDATCPHLGCNVHWKEEQDRFACPCHKGVFTRQGELVSGPPPKPLRQLQTEIQDGILLALV